jgi:hypothetical protein
VACTCQIGVGDTRPNPYVMQNVTLYVRISYGLMMMKRSKGFEGGERFVDDDLLGTES